MLTVRPEIGPYPHPITVDFGTPSLLYLASALEDHDRESTTYYLDTESGEVVFLIEDTRGSDKRWGIISNSTGRFVPIDPMASRKGYDIMEQFVARLARTSLREKLQWSLEGPK